MEPDTTPNPLGYAQRPPAIRRWRWRIVFGTLAVVLAVLAITRGPAVWDRAMLLYWQNRCMNYTATADQVVYDNDPPDVAAFEAQGARRLATHFHERSGYGLAAPSLMEFLARSEIRLLNPECVLFMQGLTSPGGLRRLVIVTCSEGDRPGGVLEAAVDATAIEPGSWQSQPTVSFRSPRFDYPHWFKPVPALRIYAGNIDPKDPSHFTIRFKRLQEGVIEGRLDDDGRVHLLFRGSKEDGFDTPLEER